ncbi:MAG: zinc ribbon domain-containing protein [Thermoplasmata archaeon]
MQTLLTSSGRATLPLIVMVIGLFITLMYLIYRYEAKEKLKRKTYKVRESERQEDFECPRCGEYVDGDTHACHGCGAEFEKDTFLCPVCGTVISGDEDVCPECGEIFVMEENEFECPDCGKSVDEFARECRACGSSFWSPVKRSMHEPETPEEPEKKKIDASEIDVIEE